MIVPTLARMIVREHIYKPIQGKMLTLGRQTIAMTYEQYCLLLHQEGYVVPQQIIEETQIILDQVTRVGKGGGTNYITDQVFFGLLGIKEILTMDVSAYEQSDILHNFNNPIPQSLYEQFDFIIDGGTFDHLFDVQTAFVNVVKLLKPGGRIFQWNAASNFTGAAYFSFGPDLFYDYYVVNQFADCKVYIAEGNSLAQPELWDIYKFGGSFDEYGHFRSSRIQMVIALAEKAPDSTWDKIPVQAQYRDDNLWEPYRRGRERMLKSNRKSWKGCYRERNRGFKYLGQI